MGAQQRSHSAVRRGGSFVGCQGECERAHADPQFERNLQPELTVSGASQGLSRLVGLSDYGKHSTETLTHMNRGDNESETTSLALSE